MGECWGEEKRVSGRGHLGVEFHGREPGKLYVGDDWVGIGIGEIGVREKKTNKPKPPKLYKEVAHSLPHAILVAHLVCLV